VRRAAVAISKKGAHNMRRSQYVPVIASIALLAGSGVGLRAQDNGVKQINQLIKKANEGVASINDAKQQLQKTMDAYNAVLAPDVKDRQDAYKKLKKEMATAEKKRADVSSKSAEMNTEADKLFKGWQSSTAAIQSPDLRQRSEERLKKAQDRFGEIRQTGQNASSLYTPFMKTLQDQVTFLGHDLNPGAVASLKGDADKLNMQAKDLYSAIDKVTAAANSNITRLSAE
jgi:chromosome segregation ATPase